MQDASDGQIIRSAAEVYASFFVPALFAQWVPHLVQAAPAPASGLSHRYRLWYGHTRARPPKRPPHRHHHRPRPITLRCLRKPKKLSAIIDWQTGRAESLPFEEASFDVVTCQFGLMFFDDREQALREMHRVLRPDGRLVLAVWASLAQTPGYAAMAHLLEQLFGPNIAQELRAPFSLGDTKDLQSLLGRAGLDAATIHTREGTACFPSLEDWLHTDIRGWTLADKITDAQLAELKAQAPQHLASSSLRKMVESTSRALRMWCDTGARHSNELPVLALRVDKLSQSRHEDPTARE